MTEHLLDDHAALSALYGEPPPMSLDKELPQLNDLYRQLIAAAPFVSVATVGAGGLDCSPRGDDGAVVTVIDERTLALPDRRGNNRLDTLHNLIDDPRVGLLFLIPGLSMTLRVNGRAVLSVAPALIERFTVAGKAPRCVVLITIETVYFQCARAVKRARLWDPAIQVDPKTLPSAGQLTRSAAPDFDAEQYDAALEARQARTLY